MNPRKETNYSSLAITSLVLGLAGLILPIGVFSIGAAGTGHLAVRAIRRVPMKGQGLAIGGLVTGYVGILLSLVIASFIAVPMFLDEGPSKTPPELNIRIPGPPPGTEK